MLPQILLHAHFVAERCPILRECRVSFVRLSGRGHLDCVRVLLLHRAAVSTGVRVSFQIVVFFFFFFTGSLPRNGIAGSYGSTKALKLNLPQGEDHASRLPGT